MDDLSVMDGSQQAVEPVSQSMSMDSNVSQASRETACGDVNDSTGADFKPLEFPLDLKARESQLIIETLKQNSGHRQKTAEDLNISPRTLRYKIAKLKELGVAVP